ncbi:isochorismate synthase [Pseudonocardia xishanensis]|uniref:isochorismate synthase n=1 Tax=Pseudonocardia xishanensis TaxID=630995 RepID=UPI0031E84497
MTTAALPTGLRVRTREVDAPAGGLLALLPSARGPLSWVRGGEGLVGWGEVARVTTTGPGRFAEADAWWRGLVADWEIADEVGLAGTGPVAFTSMTFADSSPGSVLVVPRVVVGMRGGRAWVTEFGDPTPVPTEPVRPSRGLRYADGDLPVAGYRAAVAEAVRRMREGELDKAALAHDLLAVSEADHDPRHLLRGLAARYPTCWAYAVDGLVGATPELLLRKRAGTVESRVLAGTVWPGSGELGTEKNLVEHRYAVDSLVERLQPFCRALDVPAAPSVLALPNVSHLATDVRGRTRGDASLLRIAGAVHPTAAVGGTPRTEALELISALEGMDRGRYAGPVGWVGSAGDGELGVALRCAQLTGPVARLFAGCGIVADSDPDTEVREAAAKLRAVREAL